MRASIFIKVPTQVTIEAAPEDNTIDVNIEDGPERFKSWSQTCIYFKTHECAADFYNKLGAALVQMYGSINP